MMVTIRVLHGLLYGFLFVAQETVWVLPALPDEPKKEEKAGLGIPDPCVVLGWR